MVYRGEDSAGARRKVSALPVPERGSFMPAAVDGAPGGALERVDPISAMTEKSLYEQADARKLAAFKAKSRGLSDVEVAMALEMIGSLGLNPWANEVYAAKGKNGQLLIMVGRDGLLRKSEEFPDYQGYEAGVVYEGDEFFKDEPDPDAKTLRKRAGVTHRQGLPKPGGRILGAWAVAERRGRPPRYFFARFEEYAVSDSTGHSPWVKQPSVMIEKVPISVVHRTLCNLSGVYLPEEVESTLNPSGERPVSREEEQGQIAGVVDGLDAPEEVKDTLLAGIAEINHLSPGAWGLSKCQMVLPGLTGEELAETAERIQREILIEQERVQRAAEEEMIADAQVVGEDVETLNAQRDALVERLMATEPGSEEYAALSGELDGIESRLEEIA